MSVNHWERTDAENMASILQNLVKATKELKEENAALHKDMAAISKHIIQADEVNTSAHRMRKSNKRAKASKDCQSAVRKVYKTLINQNESSEDETSFKGFLVDKRFDAPENKAVTRKLVEETISDNIVNVNGVEKCEFSTSKIKCAIKRYFLSKKDDSQRKASGKLKDHRLACKKQQRLYNKLESRWQALDTIDWDAPKKEKYQAVMDYDYMSSEESEEEVEENGSLRKIFVVKCLPWERTELREMKKELDNQYRSSLTKRSLFKRFKRNRNGLSTRIRPVNGPSWAVRSAKRSGNRKSMSASV